MPDDSLFPSPSSTAASLSTETVGNLFQISTPEVSGPKSSAKKTEIKDVGSVVEDTHCEEGHPSKDEEIIEAESSSCIEVLVVDDSKLSRRMLLRFLESESCTCDEAEDGLAAVQKVIHRSQISAFEEDIDEAPSSVLKMYDAILMDFMMPVMDGPTATKKIRDMGYKGLILGVTGNALPSDIDVFVDHGADRVLTKPVNVDSLRIALRDLTLRGGLHRKKVFAN